MSHGSPSLDAAQHETASCATFSFLPFWRSLKYAGSHELSNEAQFGLFYCLYLDIRGIDLWMRPPANGPATGSATITGQRGQAANENDR